MEKVSPAGRCYLQWSAQCSTYWWHSACQQQRITAKFKAQIFRCSDFKICTLAHLTFYLIIILMFGVHYKLMYYCCILSFGCFPGVGFRCRGFTQKKKIQHSEQGESVKSRIMYFSPYSIFPLLRSKYFTQHPILQRPV